MFGKGCKFWSTVEWFKKPVQFWSTESFYQKFNHVLKFWGKDIFDPLLKQNIFIISNWIKMTFLNILKVDQIIFYARVTISMKISKWIKMTILITTKSLAWIASWAFQSGSEYLHHRIKIRWLTNKTRVNTKEGNGNVKF